MQRKWLVHSAGKIAYFGFVVLQAFFRCKCRAIHSVVSELGVQAHPQKFWFVENLGKIPESSGR